MNDSQKIKILREKTQMSISECQQVLKATKGNLEKAEKILIKKGAENFKTKSVSGQAGIIEAYVHNNQKIGAIVELKCETDWVARTPEFKNLAHELVLQISAMAPKNLKNLLKQPYIKEETMTIKDLISQTTAILKEKIEITNFCRYQI